MLIAPRICGEAQIEITERAANADVANRYVALK